MSDSVLDEYNDFDCVGKAEELSVDLGVGFVGQKVIVHFDII